MDHGVWRQEHFLIPCVRFRLGPLHAGPYHTDITDLYSTSSVHTPLNLTPTLQLSDMIPLLSFPHVLPTKI
jgi:hypothetical protein